MQLDPAALSPQDRYKFLIGAIVPRPIAFVSTISPDGRANLAPFSFYAGVASSPMSLLFCPANRGDGRPKDTLRNAAMVADGGTGEFAVNVAAEPFASRVAAAAEPLPYGDSEFDLVGLTPEPCSRIRPPRVAESPLTFECRTLRIIHLAPGVPGGGNIVVGEVVWIMAREGVVDARRRVDPEQLRAFGRMGGTGYCLTRACFEMPVGAPALSLPEPPWTTMPTTT